MPLLILRGYQDAQDMDDLGHGWITEVRGHQIDETLGPYGGFILDTVKVNDPRVFRGRVPISQEDIPHRRMDDGKLVVTVTEYILEADELDAQGLIAGRVGWSFFYVKDEAEARMLYASPEERRKMADQRLAAADKAALQNAEREPVAEPERVENPVTADPGKMPHDELVAACKALKEAGGPDINLNSQRPVLEQYYREVGNATD